jgi:hypothetical protein
MAKNKATNEEARRRITNLLDKAMDKFESEVGDGKVKPSMGDYLKLMQLKQEIEQQDEDAREIEVRWVDPEATTSDGLE